MRSVCNARSATNKGGARRRFFPRPAVSAALTLCLFSSQAYAVRDSGLSAHFDIQRFDTLQARLCTSEPPQAFVAAAANDGIVQPRDFVAFLQALWCERSDNAPFVAQLKNRLAVPFRLDAPTSRRVLRKVDQVFSLLSEGSYTLSYAPYSVSVDVDPIKQEVKLDTSREGGGDVISFIFAQGRWKLNGFSGGDGC